MNPEIYMALAGGALLCATALWFAWREASLRAEKAELMLMSQTVRAGEMQHLALTDGLTGLANARLFNDRLSHALGNASRNDGNLGVIFLDLNGFKAVNDKGGHACGDDVLKLIAIRINETVREVDTVARLGGDEFAVILENTSPDAARAIAAKLERETLTAVQAGSETLEVSSSIGIAIYPQDGHTLEELVGAADLMMYGDKERRKGNRKSTNEKERRLGKLTKIRA